ncbi:uncharacterized protein CIMG_13263 [Coccidioides immitis RS]|uniref:Uncharacterized protein n=1 Tax=Coccidioides immitis (strain RS) TaxID=246410 RepID=A0A0D8JU61_COCIM|nr:uncharacterized protein CIMG_13263 [Coccidioides immitis RS]KJF60827.1 hypothetical protein CIMG_13263 [Coccidioides immitis RS]
MEGHRRKRANGQYQHSAHLLCSFVVNPALIDVQLHVDWDSRTVPLTWLKVQGPQESVEWPHCLDVHAYLGKAGKLYGVPRAQVVFWTGLDPNAALISTVTSHSSDECILFTL